MENLRLILGYFRRYISYCILKPCFSNFKKADDFQRSQLAQLLNYAKHNVPYFRTDLEGKCIDKKTCIEVLKSLPVLTKDIIRLNENTIYSEKIDLSKALKRTTGGSTGEPFGFYCVKQRIDFENILGIHLYRMMGWKYNETIVAFDGYIPQQDSTKLSNQVSIFRASTNFPYGKYHFSSYLLNEKTIEVYVKELNRIKPVVFRGYSSTISKLCLLIEKKGLTLNFKLKGLYVTSDKCTDEDEILIQRVLDCPVWGQYGHTEASIFAIKRSDSKEYLCSPLYGYTEVINRITGDHVEIGEQGEIVVTGFTNYGLPFIRYATGDLAIYGGVDKSNNVILSELQGRSADYILDAGNKKIYLTGLVFGAHIKAFSHMDSWQIVQNESGTIKLNIEKGKDFCSNDEIEIFELFKSVGVHAILDYNGKIQVSKRGKRLFMIQNCK